MRSKESPIPKTKVIDGKRYHIHMVAYNSEDAELKAKMLRTYFGSVRTTTMSEAGREFYLIWVVKKRTPPVRSHSWRNK